MSKSGSSSPYYNFGQSLKVLREQANESPAEVAGALEADTKLIYDIEAGLTQPSEDIVLLLISHFGVKDKEASRLWKMAGYDQSLTGHYSDNNNSFELEIKNATQAINNPIVYTDIVQVNANRYGVIINFMQSLPGASTPMAISRVGMSREHALSMIDVLKSTINAIEQGAEKLAEVNTTKINSEKKNHKRNS